MQLFALRNPRLVRLDRRVFQHNVLFSTFYHRRTSGRPVNYPVLDRLIEGTQSLLTAVARVDPTHLLEFERLVLRHLEANLRAQDAYLQYWFLNGIPHIGGLVEAVFGVDALPYLEELFTGYDFEMEARLIDLESRIAPELLAQGHHAVLRMIETLVPILKAELMRFAGYGGYLPAMVRAQLPPQSIAVILRRGAEARGAAWHEASRTVEISEHEFHVNRVGDRVLINPGLALLTLAHEILGHAANGVCSIWMPLTATGADENLTNLTSMPTVEGLALVREELGKEFLKTRRKQLAFEGGAGLFARRALHQEEVDLALLLNEFEDLERILRCYAGYLGLRQVDDPGFNAAQEFVRRWRGHLSHSRHRIIDKAPVAVIPQQTEVFDFLYDLAYLLGPRLVRNAYDRIEAEFGEEFTRRNRALVAQVMATGTWAMPVYADWVLFAVRSRKAFAAEAERALRPSPPAPGSARGRSA